MIAMQPPHTALNPDREGGDTCPHRVAILDHFRRSGPNGLCLQGSESKGLLGPNFFGWLHRDDPLDALHDFLVLLGLLQVVGCLQPHPHFGRTAEQPGHLQAHDGG
jgi:hypothetical protein